MKCRLAHFEKSDRLSDVDALLDHGPKFADEVALELSQRTNTRRINRTARRGCVHVLN